MAGPRLSRRFVLISAAVFGAVSCLSLTVQGAPSPDAIAVPKPIDPPDNMDGDAAAFWLARRCVEGGEDARPALIAALDRMGWGVKDRKGNLLRSPEGVATTGLAMRDYEIESLFWNTDLAPSLRLITFSRALAVTLPTADPEDLAQGLLDALRAGAESSEPRRRFWARFVIGLGMAQDGIDLSGPGDPLLAPVDPKAMHGLMPQVPEGFAEAAENASDAEKIQMGMAMAAAMMQQGGGSFAEMMAATMPKPMWALDDPVLGSSPRSSEVSGEAPPASVDDRIQEAQSEMLTLMQEASGGDSAASEAASRRMVELQTRINSLQEVNQISNYRNMAKATDPDFEDEDEVDDGEARFMAEHRATPLSVLQVALLTHVIVADILGDPAAAKTGMGQSSAGPQFATASIFPISWLQLAQAAPAGGPPTTFAGQISAAGADMWATGWGTYTNAVLDVHMPDSKFADRVGKANAIMGWLKTVIMLAQNKIRIELEDEPLIRTKTRAAGQQRRAKCVVEIDFPKTPDAVKAIRGIMNIASIDLQVLDGGPVSGAKVTWRLTEGSYNGKYQTASGGKTYRPDLAIVQFAKMAEGAAANSAYVSYSNDRGEAFITIEGTPQRKSLPQNVREKQRRAAIAVEVNMKVGNLMQDLNDALGVAGIKGAPGVLGVVTMISEMIQRSSLFFQRGRVFQVIDWVVPAWEGDIVITVKGSGSKTEKGEKGGPDVRYEWSMNRAMEAHVQTPEWEQDEAHESGVTSSDRVRLEIANDSKRYNVNDFSAQTSRDVEAAFTAEGPVEIQPKSGGGPAWPSRAEPSGFATLTTWPETDPPKYVFSTEPSFFAKALVFNYERNKGRTRTETNVQTYSLMGGVYPAELSEVGTWDPAEMTITGHKTIEARGSLPHVPAFDVVIQFAYTLRYTAPPPENAR